jgi:hypothetical protein
MALQSILRSRRRSALCIGPLLAAALTLSGCKSLGLDYSTADVAGTSLSTAAAAGEQRLQIETEYDSAIRELITQLGHPEYLHVIDRENLYLFYTELDRVAVVTRYLLPPGDIQIFERTPGYLLKLLPQTEIDEILARRQVSDRVKRAETSKTRRANKQASLDRQRTSPAARAPDAGHSGVSFSDFDPKRIVERLQTPLSAADPGISGWRNAQLADGTPKRIASAGSVRYQIGTDVVSVAAPIAPRGRTTPAPTRHGVYRLNQAVFGTRGNAVNEHMDPLIARVAADPTGETRIVQRVAGRTVMVTRDPERGFLIYAITAQ